MRKIDINTKNIVLSAMFAAMICVATFIIRIPTPLKGYINLGDCFVLLAAWKLSKKQSFFSAAIGTALADIIAGYVVYAPCTFIIKGAMALAAAYAFSTFSKTAKLGFNLIASGIIAECIMVFGYFAYEAVLYGIAPSLANIPLNALQGAICLILGYVLFKLVGDRIDTNKRIMK